MKNTLCVLVSTLIFFQSLSSQNIAISLPPNPPSNTANWATGGNMLTITVTGTAALAESNMLVYIRSTSGQVVCGTNQPALAQPSNIKPGAPKAWAGQAAISLLGNSCVLPVGSYEFCVQLLPLRNQGKVTESLEKCMPFDIRPVECGAPSNVKPGNEQQLSPTDILKPVIFNWTPIIMQGRPLVTYRLMVWEVEEGQTIYEAMYNNYPVITKDVKGATQYIVPPGNFEKRAGTYVWRVFAMNDDGVPLCKNAQSEPTTFSVAASNVPIVAPPIPLKDSTPQQSDSCCANKIIDKGKTATVSPANVAAISQKFNITPTNIKYITAEIVSVKESAVDTACMKCASHENWIYNFISPSTSKWNSDPALSGSPVNSSGYLPAKMLEWYCNKQGDIQFQLKIPLPENNTGCTRKSTICIRYRFTDANCVNCEQIICYDFNN